MPGWIQGIVQDARFGARILLRSPGVTLLVVLALTLGIGANSAMFSVVDALLLHPLRYGNPDELTVVFDRDPQGQLRGTSPGNFLDWRKAKSFRGLAGWAPAVYVMSGLERPVQVPGARVTANMFQVLGVKPLMGRTFLVGEDGLDGSATISRVAVISYGLWQSAFGADPNVLGRMVRLNDTPFAVIGVMQPGFELFNRRHQIWVPATLDASNRDYRYLQVVGRLAAPLPEAAAEMSAISRSLSDAFPGNNRGWTAQVQGFAEWLVDKRIRTRLLLLFSAVGLVLLLACGNVASLLLARSATRSREIALRASLGATRGRIIRQLIVESLLLSAIGGALGLALAYAVIQAAPSFVPPSAIPTTAPLELSSAVAGFTLAISLLTGILFGLAPALVASNPDVQETLQDTTRAATGGRGRSFFRQAMVTVEVAVALALLSGAGLMARSLQRLAEADLGVRTSNVVTQRIFLPTASYNAERTLQYQLQAMEQVRVLPGVMDVAMGSNLPLSPLAMEAPFDLESAPVRGLSEMPAVGYTTISPGYFGTLGAAFREGRDFAQTDAVDAPGVAIVNEAFTARYFPNGGAVGQRLRIAKPALGRNGFLDLEYVEIVGVVRNVTLGEVGAPPTPILYVPLAQNIWSTAHWLVARVAGDAGRTAAAIHRTVEGIDTNQPMDSVTSLDASLTAKFAEPRFQSQLMGGFAVLALVLAVVGIYGVNAYSVTQRQREIGVRLALGGTSGSIVRSVVADGMKLTLTGIVIGIGGAAGLNAILASALLDVAAFEWAPVVLAAWLLTVVAAIACYIPARRATSVDPASILRKE